ncbi:RBBP9/YdeN family alpha/beta hydrolase [Hymenobacter cellulosivorans]|uniref:Alpha/beta fold hydrolase n=1 Tax=Hymenobacter cellulosivorans TaxID=2932249 RepID=A0ABY4FF83_9BACT|nr:alpha/beta fold hydrolase [Hymenobacter cellulosivorans]UOQ55055.1 alpha/beta fold hydrolase [Hymenobacter cellulosivorans]
MSTLILTVPGLGSSGPEHWQSLWEHLYGYQRVEQREWDAPRRPDWVATLAQAVQAAPGPVVLVGHSLACSTIAYWAWQHAASKVHGALLVAPADTEQADFPAEAVDFAPMPLRELPFPSIVVASTNDEYVTLARATEFARAWGSRLVNAGALGHLNSTSGLGQWPAGHALLQELVAGR